MAKRDNSKIEALKEAWNAASLVDKETFVVWVGKESHTVVEAATRSLFSQNHEQGIELSEEPATPEGVGRDSQT